MSLVLSLTLRERVPVNRGSGTWNDESWNGFLKSPVECPEEAVNRGIAFFSNLRKMS